MAGFRDNSGRTWTVALTIAGARRLRDRVKVNVLERNVLEVVTRILDDPILMVDVLYVLVEDDARKLGVSDEDFGRSMAGDAIEGGASALLEAIRDFCPSPRDRARMDEIIQAIRFAAEQLRERQDQMATEVAQKLRDAAISGELWRSLPESSESTQDH